MSALNPPVSLSNPSSQIVTQDSDIELFLTLDVSFSEVRPRTPTGPSGGASIMTTYPSGYLSNTGLSPGNSYRVSVKDMVNNGINVAVQTYRETTKSRVAIQHTEQGIFIDPYKTAPPILTITFAAEMPQAAYTKMNFENSSVYNINTSQTELFSALGQLAIDAGLGAVAAISPSLLAESEASLSLLSVAKPHPKSYKTFTEIMDAIVIATSQKYFPNIANLYFLDFGRNVFEKISILNVSQKSSSEPLNVIFYTLTCAVLSSGRVPTNPTQLKTPDPTFLNPTSGAVI